MLGAGDSLDMGPFPVSMSTSANHKPSQPSDHIGSLTFSVSKITVSKERKKTAVSRFYLEEKGFRDSKEKKHLSISISMLKGKSFFLAFC